jgi:hypothetical protein
MRYLIIDKKQRINTSKESTYAQDRFKEELEKKSIPYLFAFFEDISIDMLDGKMKILIGNEDILGFTHIIFRGHHLGNLLAYETKKIIAHYIDQFNINNSDKVIHLQNIESLKFLPYYDKLYVYNLCIENNLPIIPSYYKTSGDYLGILPYPFIIKDVTGENDVVVIDGKEKIKKNVYLIEKEEDLKQERLIGKNLTKYYAHKFLTSGEDFRVFVAKGTVIGGFSRKAQDGFFTVKQGIYTFFNIENNSDIVELAQKAANVFKADFIAIDIMKDENNKPLIQEISLNPGFKAYETKIGEGFVNIAKAIIETF